VDKVGISVLQRGDAASLRNKMIPHIDKNKGTKCVVFKCDTRRHIQ